VSTLLASGDCCRYRRRSALEYDVALQQAPQPLNKSLNFCVRTYRVGVVEIQYLDATEVLFMLRAYLIFSAIGITPYASNAAQAAPHVSEQLDYALYISMH
jgi:hypothetical protein